MKFEGSAKIGAPLGRTGIGPIDERSVVTTVSDLTGINVGCYTGQMVYVVDEQTFYVGKTDKASEATLEDWVKLSSTFNFTEEQTAALRDLAGAMHYRGTVHFNSWQDAWDGSAKNGDVYYIGEEISFPNMNYEDPKVHEAWDDLDSGNQDYASAGGAYKYWENRNPFMQSLPKLFNLPTETKSYTRENLRGDNGEPYTIGPVDLPVGTVTPGAMVIYTDYYDPDVEAGAIGWLDGTIQIESDNLNEVTISNTVVSEVAKGILDGSIVYLSFTQTPDTTPFYAKTPDSCYKFTTHAGTDADYDLTKITQPMFPHKTGWVYISTTTLYTDTIGFEYNGPVQEIVDLDDLFTRSSLTDLTQIKRYKSLDAVLEKIISKVWWTDPTITDLASIGSTNSERNTTYNTAADFSVTISDPSGAVIMTGEGSEKVPNATITSQFDGGTGTWSINGSSYTYHYTAASKQFTYDATSTTVFSITVPYTNSLGEPKNLQKSVSLPAGKLVYLAKCYESMSAATADITAFENSTVGNFTKPTSVNPSGNTVFMVIAEINAFPKSIKFGLVDEWYTTGGKNEKSAEGTISRRDLTYKYWIKENGAAMTETITLTY